MHLGSGRPWRGCARILSTSPGHKQHIDEDGCGVTQVHALNCVRHRHSNGARQDDRRNQHDLNNLPSERIFLAVRPCDARICKCHLRGQTEDGQRPDQVPVRLGSVDQEQKHGDGKYRRPEYFILYSGRHKAGWILVCIQKSQRRVQKQVVAEGEDGQKSEQRPPTTGTRECLTPFD
jgi:hypothetical protein